MSSVLRGGYVDVEVHLVDEVASIDASSARSSASEIPASSPPATNVVEVGTLAPSPEIPPGPPGEYLRTGVRVRRGFASGRVVTRARTRFGAAVRREWGCRGDILRHLLHLEAACVELATTVIFILYLQWLRRFIVEQANALLSHYCCT